MTPEQADAMILKLTGIDARVLDLVTLRPAEDMWLMVIGCCLVVLVFFEGAKFWRGLNA